MTFRHLLAATLLASGVLAGTAAARADTTVNFTAYNYNDPSELDVTGSFSYTSSNNPLGYADLTAFNIDFPNLPAGHSYGLSFVQAPQPSSVFSFDPTADALSLTSGYVFESTDANYDGFKFFEFSPTEYYYQAVLPGDPSGHTGYVGALTFTTAGSSSAVPEPPAAAVLGLALFGLVLVRGRGGRLRGA